MNADLVLFAVAAGLAIVFALAMVVQKTPVRSVLSLVVTFFGIAVLSVMLAAPFIAAHRQVIVYAGAILVLFLFVIMLLNLNEEARGEGRAGPSSASSASSRSSPSAASSSA